VEPGGKSARTCGYEHQDRIEDPEIPFNEANVKEKVSYWPNGFVKRLS
jgi:hypothetical protein